VTNVTIQRWIIYVQSISASLEINTSFVVSLVNTAMSASQAFHKYRRLLFAISALIIAVFFFSPPVTLLDKTHAIGYAICHQLPARTFHLNQTPLPLCARCTGIYLGILLGIGGICLRGRQRSIEFPSKPILFILLGFIGLMGFDGVNSYLSFFPHAPRLYEPQNWLRLITGTLHGLAISAIVWPVLNQSLWHPSTITHEPVISSFKELAFLVAGSGLMALLVLWQHPLLLYPLTILSTAGVLMILSLLSTAFVLLSTRQDGQARTWGDLVLPLGMGLAIALLLISGMDGLRAWLTRDLPQPFL
jgi:uncharacterized membrane protein